MTYLTASNLVALRAAIQTWRAQEQWPISVRELAARQGCNTSTAYHHLLALTERGYMETHPGGRQIGWRPTALALAHAERQAW